MSTPLPSYRTLADVGSVAGKRVLLRLDFNVALEGGRVLEDFRLRKAFPTIDFLRKGGARIVMVGHLEDPHAPKGAPSPSVSPIYDYLKGRYPVRFLSSGYGADSMAAIRTEVSAMKDGDMVMLENIRLDEGEKKNSKELAASLASLADIYVNDAFSVSHRAHASIVGVPALIPGYAGFTLDEEVKHLSEAFAPAHPFLFVLGGAKFDTKLPLIKRFLGEGGADVVYVGGALANDIYKAKGLPVGLSTVSDGSVDLSAIAADQKVRVPQDAVASAADLSLSSAKNVLVASVGPSEKIVDAGAGSIEELRGLVSQASFILWNGPLGFYEKGYRQATLALAEMIAARSGSGAARSIVGGGDTLAAIAALKNEDKFTFVSTAGGAMLDFLANGTLPGIDALRA